MKIAIVGSRDFNDYEFLLKKMEEVVNSNMLLFTYEGEFPMFSVVSGGARGADTLAERFALEHGVPIEIFYPDWNHNPKSAGILRNLRIIDASDIIVAFWDGKSTGTKHTIDTASKLGKDVYVFNFTTKCFHLEAKIATIEHLYDE
jgi:predicted Rossmann fold nucleotide-binding protein DprA/Smf involved in DNA uptake